MCIYIYIYICYTHLYLYILPSIHAYIPTYLPNLTSLPLPLHFTSLHFHARWGRRRAAERERERERGEKKGGGGPRQAANASSPVRRRTQEYT